MSILQTINQVSPSPIQDAIRHGEPPHRDHPAISAETWSNPVGIDKLSGAKA